jgi:uncharacterized protein YukJ
LRVGLDVANNLNKEFYFIFLDIAPFDKMLKYGDEKSVSARYFLKYRNYSETLTNQLVNVPYGNVEQVSQNMGWLTWASLFKTTLRAVIQK